MRAPDRTGARCRRASMDAPRPQRPATPPSSRPPGARTVLRSTDGGRHGPAVGSGFRVQHPVDSEPAFDFRPMPPSPALSVSLADVLAARERIAGHVHRTPVLTSRQLDARLGCRVFFKCEVFQRIGAFKARGAFSRINLLT